MSEEYYQHLHSQLKYVLVNSWNYREYIPVVPSLIFFFFSKTSAIYLNVPII